MFYTIKEIRIPNNLSQDIQQYNYNPISEIVLILQNVDLKILVLLTSY